MNIVLWLPIRTPPASLIGGAQQLWRRQVTTGCVPVPNMDKVQLWTDEDGEGPSVKVKSREMRADGIWSVELATVVIDPDDHATSQMRSAVVAGHAHYHEPVWSYGKEDYLDQLRVNLMCTGWVEQ